MSKHAQTPRPCDCRAIIHDGPFSYPPDVPEGGTIEIEYCAIHSAAHETERLKADNDRLRAINQKLVEALEAAPCKCECDMHESDFGFRDDVCLYVRRGHDAGPCIRVVCTRCAALAKASAR